MLKKQSQKHWWMPETGWDRRYKKKGKLIKQSSNVRCCISINRVKITQNLSDVRNQ